MARTTKPTSNVFDYTVEQLPLYDRDGKTVRVGGSPIMGNFRTDNGICLGTSTEKYEIVNNKEIYRGEYDFVEESNGMYLISLSKGERH